MALDNFLPDVSSTYWFCHMFCLHATKAGTCFSESELRSSSWLQKSGKRKLGHVQLHGTSSMMMRRNGLKLQLNLSNFSERKLCCNPTNQNLMKPEESVGWASAAFSIQKLIFGTKHSVLPPNLLATFDAAAGLSKAALLKCSKARLQATYSEFQDSTSWSTWNGGIASSEGCLKLDNIDLNTTADDIAERWSKVFDNPVASDKLWQQESVEGCKHDVCQGWFGTCSKLPHVKLAVSFVLAMHKLLSAGFLVKQFLIVMFTCFYTCYYVDNFFSISHTIVLKFTFCCSWNTMSLY